MFNKSSKKIICIKKFAIFEEILYEFVSIYSNYNEFHRHKNNKSYKC